MNNKKIAFIMCVNNEARAQEAIDYIERLAVPDGFEKDILVVKDAKSMTAGYNEAMLSTDAKYKVYLHQDVLIIEVKFISFLLEIFSDESVGMIGMVGSPKLPEDATMWDGQRVGTIYACNDCFTKEVFFGPADFPYSEVEAVDGLLIATQYDLQWRADLFDKWDLYDLSQSFEFRKKGYKVVVPYSEKPWVIHDDGNFNLVNYYDERLKFVKEYLN